MNFFINIWAAYAPVFRTYIFPFMGVLIIAYGIYLIFYMAFGKE